MSDWKCFHNQHRLLSERNEAEEVEDVLISGQEWLGLMWNLNLKK